MITGDEYIADILVMMPDSSDILESYGLSCSTCSMQYNETLAAGVRKYNISDAVYDALLLDLNELYNDMNTLKTYVPVLTNSAKQALQGYKYIIIDAFYDDSNALEWYIEYGMDDDNDSLKAYKHYVIDDIYSIYIHPSTLKHMIYNAIDYDNDAFKVVPYA